MPTPESCPPPGFDGGAAAPCGRERTVTAWRDDHWHSGIEALAEEVPVALVYNGHSHAVMLATPADLDDLARGFTLTEGILPPGEHLREVRLERHVAGLALAIAIPAVHAARLANATRMLPGRSGCGLCGSRHLENAMRWPRRVDATQRFTNDALRRAHRPAGPQCAHRRRARRSVGRRKRARRGRA